MILYPNCKINIGLNVVRKRADGYHDLETIFYPIHGLHDVLQVERLNESATGEAIGSIGYRFHQEGIVVDCPEDKNLIIRCYKMFKEEFGTQVGSVDIHFRKNIPFGAGLGGGSSDAAHMALALNELFSLGLSKPELARRVAHLGADCAFFIYNTPCYAEGIGDILTEIDFSLRGKRILMLKPEVGVSTKDAYSGICPSGVIKGYKQLHTIEPALLTNAFETTVFAKYPVLGDIKKRLQQAGAFYAAMSGSGSTIYGLFEDNAERGSLPYLGLLNEELASMVILNDTLS